MSVAYLLFLALCFLAVVMLLEGLYLTWNAHLGPEARRIEERLRAISAAGNHIEASIVKKRLLSDIPAVDRVLMRLPRIRMLDRFLLQSAMDITVATFLGVAAALALAVALALFAFDAPWWVCIAGAVLIVLAWTQFVQVRRVRRMRRVSEQLPDALDLMARAMQAGHSFSSALHLVGTEGPHPISGEFRTTFDEINFGIPFDRALSHLAHRVSSEELRFFVVAVLIQRESGGNLAEILTSIAALLRDRQKLAGTVRVLSAEGRLSAWILTLLPFALGGIIFLIHRDYLAILWRDPMGIRAMGFMLALMVFGIWWMWRLTRIRV